MTEYRIGAIDYLNSLPINASLERELEKQGKGYGCEIVWGSPAFLNQLVQEGVLHLSPVSSIHYALHQDELLILPQLSISSQQAVRSVLLFSREPLSSIKRVALPDTSATSIYQLQILLSQLSSFPVDYVVSFPDLHEMLEVAQAALLIGDDALRASQNMDADVHLYDLGSLWYERTEEMMVHALWVVRKEVAYQDSAAVYTFHQAILSARDWGLSQLNQLILGIEEMGEEEAKIYYSHLYYGLGEKEIFGLKRFFTEAYRLSLIGEQVELNFWGDEPCSTRMQLSPAGS